MRDSHLRLLIAVVLFFILVIAGYWLAKNRPLWTDELYTQSQIGRLTHKDIWPVYINEGNVCPLFYSIQKWISDLASYQTPESILNMDLEAGGQDQHSQIILRINPIVFSALAVVAVFYFFAVIYSWTAGIYAVLVMTSSYMFWAYFVEARPYALWLFLTTLQTLNLLYLLLTKKRGTRPWLSLIVVHILLALTAVFSANQIVVVSLVLWIWVDRKWQRYIFLTLLPVVLCVMYYFHSPRYQFIFEDSPLQLINANLPKDRMAIIFLFAVFVLAYGRRKITGGQMVASAWPYLVFVGAMLFTTALVLFKFKLSASAQGFQVSNRYFIYLTPIGAIGTTFFSIVMYRALKDKRIWQRGLVVLLAVLLFLRFQQTFLLIRGFYHF